MSLVSEIIECTVKYVPCMCWSNAVETLLTVEHPALEGAVYVEGWAIPEGMGLAVEHAWLKLANGSVLDLTWLDCEARYFPGVEYSKEELTAFDPDFLPIVWITSGWGGFGNASYKQSYFMAVEATRRQAV